MNHQYRIYLPPEHHSQFNVGELVLFIVLFIVLFFIFYGALSFPVVVSEAQYFWKTKIKDESFGNAQEVKRIFGPTLPTIPKAETPKPQQTKELADNHLFIPEINVEVPIIFNVDYNNILDNLLDGVAHYNGSALPGQDGNVFITGHSSNYWWVNSPYNQIFLHLDKLHNGDKIAITYQGVKHTYQVSEILIVNPTDVWVLNKTPQPTLTLMTCTPPGTNLKRLIVRALEVVIKNQSQENLSPPTAPILPSP